jgi:hypothetical protein
VTLPLQAINYTLYGDSVYVIDTKDPLVVPPSPFAPKAEKKSSQELKDKAEAEFEKLSKKSLRLAAS